MKVLTKQNQPAQQPIKKRSAKQNRQYLEKVLALNPVAAAQQMVELRWQFCGFHSRTTKGSAADDLGERRKWNRKQLELIRAEFWLMDSAKVHQALDELIVDDLPELKIGVDRLKQLTHCRRDMDALARNKKRDINLYNTFRRLVMLSPRKAGRVKEEYLRSLPYAENIDRVRRMVKLMKAEYPNLYAIEADWFSQILKIKSRNVSTSHRAEEGISFDLGIPSWMYVVTVILLFRFLLAMMRFGS